MTLPLAAPFPLLQVKLIPPAPGVALLRRGRLVDRLSEGLADPNRRGTAIVAGAGYGKTTLVSQFLQESDLDAVWYSLDASDRDPSVFFRYVIEGIREHCEDFGRLAARLLEDTASLSQRIERLVDVLINDMNETLSSRVCLVLDDFHELDDSGAILKAIRRLLTYLPDSLHVIITSRTVPQIGISRLKSTGRLGVIDQQDLAFLEEETRDLFIKVLGLEVDTARLAAFQAASQGWVTALQLIRQEAAGRRGGELPEGDALLARTREEIFEYFGEGVYAGEGDQIQVFLRRSSLPGLLQVEVLARALDDLPVRGLIEDLLRRNLFIVPLAGRTESYTYHGLFREFLERKLAQIEGEDAVRDLHVRYAQLFEEREEFAPALRHYEQAEAAGPLAALLAREGPGLIRHGMLDTVRRACERVEASGPVPAPVTLLQAEIARIEGDYAIAVRRFEAGLSGEGDLDARTRAEALQAQAYAEMGLGALARATALAREAQALAPAEDLGLRGKILNTCAIAAYRSNRYEEAIGTWQEAMELARRAGDRALLRTVAHNLGLPYGMRGEYDKALSCFRMLLNFQDEEDAPLGREYATASLNVARIEILQGEFGDASRHLDDALEISRKLRLRSLQGDVLEAQGNLLREMEHRDAAREKYAQARDRFTELGLADLCVDLEEDEIQLLLNEGAHDEALRRCEELLARYAADEQAPAARRASLLQLEGRARLGVGGESRAPEAARLLDRARLLYRDLSFRFQEAESGLLLARAHMLAGDREAATRAARAALGLVTRFGYRHMARRAAATEPLRGLLSALPEAAELVGEQGEGPPARTTVGGSLGGVDLTINLLGSVEVYRDEQRKIPASAWSLKRALKILCYLSSARDCRATKDRIIDTFWREARPEIIRKNFHPTISYLRKALNLSHPVAKNFILFEKGAYLLNPEYRYRIDVKEFEQAVGEARDKARREDTGGALAAYRRAIDQYRGDFLEEEYDEWVEAPREHYANLLAACLEQSGGLLVAAGQAEEAAALYQRLVERDPFSEAASCKLMEALGLMGHRAGVEREYARLVRLLGKELDLEPLPETTKAYERARGRTGVASGPVRKARPT